jgi:hypothetical protein
MQLEEIRDDAIAYIAKSKSTDYIGVTYDGYRINLGSLGIFTYGQGDDAKARMMDDIHELLDAALESLKSEDRLSPEETAIWKLGNELKDVIAAWTPKNTEGKRLQFASNLASGLIELNMYFTANAFTDKQLESAPADVVENIKALRW